MRQNGFFASGHSRRVEPPSRRRGGIKRKYGSRKKIAASTVCRELKRNRNKRGGYSPGLANEMAKERRERIVRNTALKPGVLERAMKLLVEKRWSPRTDIRQTQTGGHTDIP